MQGVKFVTDMLVVESRGQPVIESGDTEIAGVRFYPDRLVVGPHGQPTLAKGWMELVQRRRGPPVKLLR